MKTALASLRGTSPIQAALQIERTDTNRDKKPPEMTSGAAAVDALYDAGGLHIAYAPALLARVVKERADRQANSEAHAPTIDALAELAPLSITEYLDYGRVLLGTVGRAVVVSEKPVVYEGHAARLLALKLNTPVPKMPIGHVELLEDSLNIWIGNDNIPIAARRTERYSGGILFLKGQGTQASRWSFVRKDDRLVAVRMETKSTSSGFGENHDETEIVTVAIK